MAVQLTSLLCFTVVEPVIAVDINAEVDFGAARKFNKHSQLVPERGQLFCVFGCAGVRRGTWKWRIQRPNHATSARALWMPPPRSVVLRSSGDPSAHYVAVELGHHELTGWHHVATRLRVVELLHQQAAVGIARDHQGVALIQT